MLIMITEIKLVLLALSQWICDSKSMPTRGFYQEYTK